jgi:hypothetical protein
MEKKVSDPKAEQGKPEAPFVAKIELYLDNFKISGAAYHGGDFNDAYCMCG